MLLKPITEDSLRVAWPVRAVLELIRGYKLLISPQLPGACRFLPTCSDYADEALARFGLWAGAWITLARLCRCHPWGTAGLDVVPQGLSTRARWYLPWRYGLWLRTHPGSDATKTESRHR